MEKYRPPILILIVWGLYSSVIRSSPNYLKARYSLAIEEMLTSRKLVRGVAGPASSLYRAAFNEYKYKTIVPKVIRAFSSRNFATLGSIFQNLDVNSVKKKETIDRLRRQLSATEDPHKFSELVAHLVAERPREAIAIIEKAWAGGLPITEPILKQYLIAASSAGQVTCF